jgi:hypothetical protein
MRSVTDGRELTGIETNCDGRDVPGLVAEIRRLDEIVCVARRMHEARRQYERALGELKACEKEKAEVEDEFSRMMNSLCL